MAAPETDWEQVPSSRISIWQHVQKIKPKFLEALAPGVPTRDNGEKTSGIKEKLATSGLELSCFFEIATHHRCAGY